MEYIPNISFTRGYKMLVGCICSVGVGLIGSSHYNELFILQFLILKLIINPLIKIVNRILIFQFIFFAGFNSKHVFIKLFN